MCIKVRYPNHKQALDALRKLLRMSRRESIPSRVYFCERCYGYHLTSMSMERQARIGLYRS